MLEQFGKTRSCFFRLLFPPGRCPPCRVDPEELAQAAPQLPPPEQPVLHQPSGHLGGHLKAQITFYNLSGSPVSFPPHKLHLQLQEFLPSNRNCHSFFITYGGLRKIKLLPFLHLGQSFSSHRNFCDFMRFSLASLKPVLGSKKSSPEPWGTAPRGTKPLQNDPKGQKRPMSWKYTEAQT